MTTVHPTQLVSSALLTQIIKSLFTVHIQNFSLTDEKFDSCIQHKCYKPHNQVKFFSRTCLSKTMIISYMIDFIKAISCSETTHVSTKQRLCCYIISKFLVLKLENYLSTQNICFFFVFFAIFCVFCSKYLIV